MLNRTLSANLNGLNLGTRTLANLAGLNIVAPTQDVPHAHPQMRKDPARGMDAKAKEEPSISIRGSFPSFASIPSPFGPSRPSYPAVVCGVEPRSAVVVDGTAGGVALRGRATRAVRSQVQVQSQRCGWQGQTRTRTEVSPGARTAAGG